MEDKKKKRQEEKKKKDAAQKKVSLWQALSYNTDIRSFFSFNCVCISIKTNHGTILNPSSVLVHAWAAFPSNEKKCHPKRSILPLPFSSATLRRNLFNTVCTILNVGWCTAQPSAAVKYAQVFLLQLHHTDHMHIEHMHFVMCVSREALYPEPYVVVIVTLMLHPSTTTLPPPHIFLQWVICFQC